MTWAEFRIRSFAFRRQREWEMQMTREVAYEIHTFKYLFGSKKPPKKQRYWPILEEDRAQTGLPNEVMEAFKKEVAEYHKNKNKKK